MTGKDFPPLFVNLFTKLWEWMNVSLNYSAAFQRMSIRKKDYYLKEGSISNAKAYIRKDAAALSSLMKCKEHILFFAFEDWWLADFESYYSGNPGKPKFPGIGRPGIAGYF